MQWPRKLVGLTKECSNEDEQDEPGTRRFRAVSTWTPPRKRSRSPRGGQMRCKSPHGCRAAASVGCRDELRSMTPENRGRSPRRLLSRWPNMGRLEREKLGWAWIMVDRKQQIIASTQDSLLEEEGEALVP